MIIDKFGTTEVFTYEKGRICALNLSIWKILRYYIGMRISGRKSVEYQGKKGKEWQERE